MVEDDQQVARQIEATLRHAGYVIDVAHDGEDGHFLGDTEPYDAVVLDLGLPIVDGLSVLQRWRRDGRGMPVLILTARDPKRSPSYSPAPKTTWRSRLSRRRCSPAWKH